MAFIRAGDRPVYTSVQAGPWYAKTLAEGLAELAQMVGQELRVYPVEPTFTYPRGGSTFATPAQVPLIGLVDYGLPPTKPTAGTRGSSVDCIFEYGSSRANVASYSLTVDREAQANMIYVPRVGFPEPGYAGTLVTKTAEDTTGEVAIGRLDAWVDPGAVELDLYRQRLADVHLALRKAPRRRITFQPTRNNIVQPYVDYNPGDWVSFRAFKGDGVTLRYDFFVRVFNITITADDAGNEAVEVTTYEDG